MKVKDLVKRLKKLPRNAEVFFQPHNQMSNELAIDISQNITNQVETWYVYLKPIDQ